MRAGAGIGVPDNIHMGVDFAGTVVSVARTVTRFKPGDAVFGGKGGAFGEYVSVRRRIGGHEARHVTFEQAAAVPIAAVTALQACATKGKFSRADGVDQWRLGRRGTFCRATCQVVRGKGDRRVQQPETWRWSDPSAPIKSSTTLKRISPRARSGTI